MAHPRRVSATGVGPAARSTTTSLTAAEAGGRHGWSLRGSLLAVGVALVVWWFVYGALLPLSQWLTYDVLGLDRTTRLGSAVAFFLYEAPKVLMLLVLVVFGVGIIRSFFTPATTRRVLAGRRESVGNVLAAGLGIVTPFCSCSAVPLFIGFVTAGVPLGVTFSFLISAHWSRSFPCCRPFLVKKARLGVVVAIVSTWAIKLPMIPLELQLFGWRFTLLREGLLFCSAFVMAPLMELALGADWSIRYRGLLEKG